jgi:hypothetical protein
MMTLRIVSLFNKDLRGLLQVAPDYMKPVNYDTRKLLRLLGPQRMTSYADGIGETPLLGFRRAADRVATATPRRFRGELSRQATSNDDWGKGSAHFA